MQQIQRQYRSRYSSLLSRRSRGQGSRGQGMTEYILIVALIAISAIGVTTLLGDNVKALFGMSGDALAGDTDVANRPQKSTKTVEKQGKGLRRFAQDNVR